MPLETVANLEAGSPRPSLAVWLCSRGPWLIKGGRHRHSCSGWRVAQAWGDSLINLGVVSKTPGAFT